MPLAATIEKTRLAVPRPTNQMAAALLWTYGTLPAFSGSTRLAPWRIVGGTTERLLWRAAGYRKPGDKFHPPMDSAWWQRPFELPAELWRELSAMAKVYDAEHPEAPSPAFNSAMATGTPAQLDAYLTLAWETLQAARAKGKEPSPPVKGPKLPGVPRPPVVVRPPDGALPPPPLPGPGGGGRGLLLLLVLGAIAWGTRKGRR